MFTVPIYSMTGYASTQVLLAAPSAPPVSAPVRLGFEIRSVNSRFLDLGFRMPDELRMHEAALRELISAQLKRGKVEVRAHLEADQHAGLTRCGLARSIVSLASTGANRFPSSTGFERGRHPQIVCPAPGQPLRPGGALDAIGT